MTNVLAGGGGNEGFHHFLKHLGPASQGWAKDMNANAFQFDSEGLSRLEQSVKVWLSKVDTAEVEAQRDEFIMHVIRLKAKTI